MRVHEQRGERLKLGQLVRLEAEPSHLAGAALSIREARLGPDDPVVAYACNVLGFVASERGNHEEALRLHRRSLEINEAYDSAHRDVAYSLEHLAGEYLELGKLDEAEPLVRRAREIRHAAVGVDSHLLHPSVKLARIALERGQTGEASALLEEILDADHRYTAREILAEARLLLARTLEMSGRDRRRAIEMARLAREGYAGAGIGARKGLNQAEAWLAQHDHGRG